MAAQKIKQDDINIRDTLGSILLRLMKEESEQI